MWIRRTDHMEHVLGIDELMKHLNDDFRKPCAYLLLIKLGVDYQTSNDYKWLKLFARESVACNPAQWQTRLCLQACASWWTCCSTPCRCWATSSSSASLSSSSLASSAYSCGRGFFGTAATQRRTSHCESCPGVCVCVCVTLRERVRKACVRPCDAGGPLMCCSVSLTPSLRGCDSCSLCCVAANDTREPHLPKENPLLQPCPLPSLNASSLD